MKIKIQSVIVIISLILLCNYSAYADESDACDCSDSQLETVMEEAELGLTSVTEKILEDAIPEINVDVFEDCILDFGSFGFSFDLSFSLTDLLSGLCDKVISVATNYISGELQSIMGSLDAGILNGAYKAGVGFDLDDSIIESPPVKIGVEDSETLEKIQTSLDRINDLLEID